MKTNKKIQPYDTKNLPDLSDIQGYDTEKREIQILFDSIKLALESSDKDQYRPRGLFIEGVSGSGKTLFAKAFIKYANIPTYLIDGTSLISSIGDAVNNINDIFNAAKKNKYSIVFIDEVGRLVPEEDYGGFSSDISRSILSCLLTNLDGIESSNNVFIVMTSNDTEAIDEALIRPGRVDKIISLKTPTIEEREKIIKYYVNKDQLLANKKIQYKIIAKKIEGYTAAGIKALVAETSVVCHQLEKENKKYDLTHLFLDRILYKLSINTSGNSSKMPDKFISRLCYHELGHVMIRYILDHSWSDVAINPTVNKMNVGGVTLINNEIATEYEEDSDHLSTFLLNKKGTHKTLSIILAGRVAESIFCDGPSNGCSEDLSHIKQIFLLAVSTGIYGYKYTYIPGPSILGGDDMDPVIQKLYIHEMNAMHKKISKLLLAYRDFIDYAQKSLAKKLFLSAEDIERMFKTFYKKNPHKKYKVDKIQKKIRRKF